jgi:predicted nucleic acid-binding protein
MNGMTDRGSIYVDANPFIYAVEGDDVLASPLNRFFELLRKQPRLAVTSELTLAEVLPKAQPPERRRMYFDLIVWSAIFDLRPVTRQVLVETATYRRAAASAMPDGRSVMPKLPDAIHVVTAIRSGCRYFLSTDGGIKLPQGMRLFEANQAGITALATELA